MGDPSISDFEKQRIGVSLAMLGALFALHEIVGGFGTRGVRAFGVAVQFRYLYFGLALVLALAVYCYALAFVSSRVWHFARPIGDILYGAALASPPLLLIFWGMSFIDPSSNDWSNIVGTAMTVIAALGVTLSQVFDEGWIERLKHPERRNDIQGLAKGYLKYVAQGIKEPPDAEEEINGLTRRGRPSGDQRPPRSAAWSPMNDQPRDGEG